MRTKYTLPLCIATFFAAAGFWAGCTVGFDPSDGADTFLCETNDECIDGFECNTEEGVCQEEGASDQTESPPCDDSENGIDQDGDGYGTGPDRSNCGPKERDCNDSDPDVYPGAPELCDNKINDCADRAEENNAANEVDDFSCESDGDCGDAPGGRVMDYLCEDGVCTMRPWNRGDAPCSELYVTCDSDTQSFTYELDGTTYDFDEGEGPADDC